jgi:hypothetical protein
MEPIKMTPVFENEEGKPLEEGQYDGMEDMLGDNDYLPTDYDIEIEDPPHEAWFAKVEAEAVAEKSKSK